MLPVARVNDFSPLGHSGQDRLQAVVGSIEMERGLPIMMGRRASLLK